MKKFEFHHKNVIILLKSFVLGGAEKQALFLANHLTNHFHCNVYIYSYIKSEQEHLFKEECKKLAIKNVTLVSNPLSASNKFKYITRRIKIALFGYRLRKHKPDVIIPYLNPPSIISNLCYRIAGAKVTFWQHRGPDYYRYDRLEKVAANKTRLFIGNSEEGRKELVDVLKIDSRTSRFLPNFITQTSITNRYSTDSKEIVLGMIAHFRDEKLQPLLVDSFELLLQDHSNIKLYLIGDLYDETKPTESYMYIKERLKSPKLKDKVQIFHQTQTSDVIDKIDIGVLISKKEGMPNVIMEFMAYGIPVVTTNHSGCKSLLGEDYSYLTENNSEDIRKKLSVLISDSELRIKVGEQNHQRVKDNFTIEIYMNRLKKMINESF